MLPLIYLETSTLQVNLVASKKEHSTEILELLHGLLLLAFSGQLTAVGTSAPEAEPLTGVVLNPLDGVETAEGGQAYLCIYLNSPGSLQPEACPLLWIPPRIYTILRASFKMVRVRMLTKQRPRKNETYDQKVSTVSDGYESVKQGHRCIRRQYRSSPQTFPPIRTGTADRPRGPHSWLPH